MRYKRILLKLSGESLMGKMQYGIDPETMNLLEIESRYEKLCSDRQSASDSYKKAERECKDLKAKRDSLLAFMGEDRSPEQEHTRKRTRE